MSHSPIVQYNGLSGLRVTNPLTEYLLFDDHTYGSCDSGEGLHDHDTHHKDQDFGAAKEKLNNAGRAIRHTAEKISGILKAAELNDKTKQKILEGAQSN